MSRGEEEKANPLVNPLRIGLSDLLWAVFFFSIVIVLFRDFLVVWFTEVIKVVTQTP